MHRLRQRSAASPTRPPPTFGATGRTGRPGERSRPEPAKGRWPKSNGFERSSFTSRSGCSFPCGRPLSPPPEREPKREFTVGDLSPPHIFYALSLSLVSEDFRCGG